jgi:hypothetical protein
LHHILHHLLLLINVGGLSTIVHYIGKHHLHQHAFVHLGVHAWHLTIPLLRVHVVLHFHGHVWHWHLIHILLLWVLITELSVVIISMLERAFVSVATLTV